MRTNPEAVAHATRTLITVKEAAARYSVSADWLYRNKGIPRVTIGRRMVRFSVSVLDNYFNNHEV